MIGTALVRRLTRRTVIVLAAAALARAGAVPLAAPASADAPPHVTEFDVVLSVANTQALLAHGVLPLAAAPATVSAAGSGATARYVLHFPTTGPTTWTPR